MAVPYPVGRLFTRTFVRCTGRERIQFGAHPARDSEKERAMRTEPPGEGVPEELPEGDRPDELPENEDDALERELEPRSPEIGQPVPGPTDAPVGR